MPEAGETGTGRRAVVYCVIPAALGPKLHESLRAHFRDDPAVEVVVDQRAEDRRRVADRRARDPSGSPVGRAPVNDRRRIRSDDGRRVADRRVPTLTVDAKPLPRRLRSLANAIVFVERIEPSSERLEDEDTARLVTRIQAGDRDAFGILYKRYFDRVYGYLRALLRNSSEAEDVTQQVFIDVFRAIDGYRRRRGLPFRAWLFTVVRNQGVSQLQRTSRTELVDPAEMARREDTAADGEPADGIPALEWISDSDLRLFMERLPLAQRQVLVLRYLVGLTTAEIAEVIGATPDTVRKRLSRAHDFLRARLAAVGRTPERPYRAGARLLIQQSRVLRTRRFGMLSPGWR